MAAGKETPGTFASLYLSGGRSSAKRSRAQQADLFGDPELAVPVESIPTSIVDDPEPPAAAERQVWTVRDLVSEIRQQVERQHFSVWVEGEISNCRPAPSGHIYFTLKDGEAQLPVVLFRRQAQLLATKPKDGDAVEVRGRVSVYESRGQLQLIAETLELRGAGALEAAFKQLKAKLKAEGLFDEERRRALPAFPRCIGVVSSPSGAVIRDIVQVARRRHARLNLLLYPAAMQGAQCAAEVAAGIRWFNKHPERVDVIILARGGGSMEDLAGFNDEELARTIAASELPVVSAIGHETDVTIADFVADLRAPTPSAAAELVTAAQHQIEERVASLTQRMHRGVRYQMILARQRYARLSAEAVLSQLRDGVNRREQRVDELRMRLESAGERRLRGLAQRLSDVTARLQRQDPTHRLAIARGQLARTNERLERLPGVVIATRTNRLVQATARLHALSPLAVLNRGYALVYAEDGRLLRTTNDISTGEAIRARLGSGSLIATVKKIEQEGIRKSSQ